MSLLISIILIMLVVAIYILKISEESYMRDRKVIEKEEREIDEEMVIHQALERAGALPSHHHREEIVREENIDIKKSYYKTLFYLVGYSIIFVEIWYLYLSIKELIKS